MNVPPNPFRQGLQTGHAQTGPCCAALAASAP